jgi:D-cysteine desulfhydrase
MDVSLPRTRLATLPTPLVRAPGLERALGAGPIYLKRDDLTGFGIAGNKTRALEFLVGAARAAGADVLVAAGSPTSNFCAAAAMAASTAGLDCDLLFPGAPPAGAVNVELARASGARLLFHAAATRDQLDDAVRGHADALRDCGRRPYAVPRGGATEVGAVGYALAARELAQQCDEAAVELRTVVVATGSGCTQAGLVAGQVGFGLPWRVVAASVSRPVDATRELVLSLSRACAQRLGLPAPGPGDVDVRDLRGPGFGVPSATDRESALIALRHEGLLLDHTYTAKALSLLRALLTDASTAPVAFLHTGGLASVISALIQKGRP